MEEKKVEHLMSAEASPEEKYLFHPLESSGENEEMENSEGELEQKMQELLKSINEETLQLNQLLIEENSLMNETCMFLKQILKMLNISYDIPPHKIPLGKRVKKAILNEEGSLIITDEKNEVSATFLAEYPSEVVMSVLWIILPELVKAVRIHKRKVSTRVNMFVKIKRELKSMIDSIIGIREGITASTEGKT